MRGCVTVDVRVRCMFVCVRLTLLLLQSRHVASGGVTEADCRTTASFPALAAVAYDYHVDCASQSACRVRTLAGESACPSGWAWVSGSGTAVTTTNGESLTTCYVRTSSS